MSGGLVTSVAAAAVAATTTTQVWLVNLRPSGFVDIYLIINVALLLSFSLTSCLSSSLAKPGQAGLLATFAACTLGTLRAN